MQHQACGTKMCKGGFIGYFIGELFKNPFKREHFLQRIDY